MTLALHKVDMVLLFERITEIFESIASCRQRLQCVTCLLKLQWIPFSNVVRKLQGKLHRATQVQKAIVHSHNILNSGVLEILDPTQDCL